MGDCNVSGVSNARLVSKPNSTLVTGTEPAVNNARIVPVAGVAGEPATWYVNVFNPVTTISAPDTLYSVCTAPMMIIVTLDARL